jgi:hypothetical protein
MRVMVVEAFLWTTIALLGPDVIRLIGDRWGIRIGDRLQAGLSVGRWIYNLGVPYLALITGAVAARDVGLTGLDGVEWLRGAIECAGALGVVWVVAGWRRPVLPYARPDRAAMDEPRWALYRGAGSLLADPLLAGPLIGLCIGLIEWGLKHRPWVQEAWAKADAWASLVRVCVSTALFLLTRNLWLIVLTQVGLSVILTRGVRDSIGDEA